VYARFLSGGAIFAPTLEHSLSVGGSRSRADINATVVDFYFVPKLARSDLFLTLDPSATFDWENDQQFLGLAVTLGARVGELFGGSVQVSVKPSAAIGADRPADWGVEVALKVIGF
jgi:hypothetical protein